jgi:hypothetical protein
MDHESTAEALILNPALSTTVVWLDPETLVLVPKNGFAPDTLYCLQFDAGVRDLAGNSITPTEPVFFSSIPGLITVSAELVYDGIHLSPPDYSTATAIEIRPYPICTSADYDIVFTLGGAEFESNCEKMTVQESISLSCVFPDSGVPDPFTSGVSWTGNQIVSITFSELTPSTSALRVYYLLRIRGGAGGIVTQEGFRLEEDLLQLLVTAVE